MFYKFYREDSLTVFIKTTELFPDYVCDELMSFQEAERLLQSININIKT